jgi:hypothetical protein
MKEDKFDPTVGEGAFVGCFIFLFVLLLFLGCSVLWFLFFYFGAGFLFDFWGITELLR